MKNKHSEIGLMTVILLFVVFAFLMQGRAHGAETEHWKATKYPSCMSGPCVVLEYDGHYVDSHNDEPYYREAMKDLAYALNRAHEERVGIEVKGLRPMKTKEEWIVPVSYCPGSGCPEFETGGSK